MALSSAEVRLAKGVLQPPPVDPARRDARDDVTHETERSITHH